MNSFISWVDPDASSKSSSESVAGKKGIFYLKKKKIKKLASLASLIVRVIWQFPRFERD
jgi:hypothetical protein